MSKSLFDTYDKHALDQSGDARELLFQLYGKRLKSKGSAEKYMAGIRVHLRHKKDQEWEEEGPENETIDYQGDKIIHKAMIDIYVGENKDPQTIMRKMGYDPGLWECIRCKMEAGFWETALNLDDTMEIAVQERLAVELSVKPKEMSVSEDWIKKVFEDLQPPDIVSYDYNPEGLLYELPIMDPHFGGLAWGEETHSGHNDLKITNKLYRWVIEDQLSSLSNSNYKIAQILFPIGQDFFHVDTPENTTRRGTPLDHDTRWQKMYQTGTETLFWTVEQLRAIAPVDIIYVPGNHDEQLSYTATHNLWWIYKDTPEVSVSLSPRRRKFYEWGKVYLGFTHGDKLRKSRMENILQVENPEIWGRTLFRELHFGHKHKQDLWEKGGATYRRISSTTETDKWHYDNGFIGALRSAQGLLWSKERGLRHILQSNVILELSDEMV